MFASLSRHLLAGSASRKASNSSRPTKRTSLRRLAVEALEDRCLLATFLVNSVGDEPDSNNADALCDNGAGHCTLRAAIQQANATANDGGPDTISFHIPGSGVHTIQPLTELPMITDPVTIDGYTQAGASPNSNGPGLGDNAVLQIELDGSLAGPNPANDVSIWTTGFKVTAGSSTIRGLAINRFHDFGIVLMTNGNNTIQGNYIGTDPTGTVEEGNLDSGILIGWYGSQSNGNTIGGLTSAARNVISGNGSVNLHIEPSDGNLIQGNFIGTDATGTVALSTAAGFRSGLFVFKGNNNTIGGTTANARNLISGNSGGFGSGVAIFTFGEAGGNQVLGNYIGTDITGTFAVANQFGIFSQSGPVDSPNMFGGTAPGAGNLISGNLNTGISMLGGEIAEGNLIGTDASGLHALGNGSGVVLNAGSTLGGTILAARNVVSGNGDGVFTLNGNNTVQGNYIGTDITGTVALGNSGHGVFITDFNSLIGGTTAGARNVIAGNVGSDVRLINSTAMTIQGNYIGTDKTGNVPLSHPITVGVLIDGDTQNVRIGGTQAGEGNLIYGGMRGIRLNGAGVHDNTIQGNSISVLPLGIGIDVLSGASNNLIGGSAANAGNRIQGDGGLYFVAAGPNNVIQGNAIHALPNSYGIALLGSDHTVVGGIAPGEGNTIDGGYSGVVIAGVSNTVRGNVIINSGEPIGLGVSDGVDVNDPLDADTGPNDRQNHPVLSTVHGGTTTGVIGVLDSAPNSTFDVDFYATTTAPQLQRYIGSTTVTTDASGHVNFDSVFPSTLGSVETVVSTATNSNGSTSEVSGAPMTVIHNSPPTPLAGGPYLVAEGGSVQLDASGSSDPDQSNDSLTYDWDLDGDSVFGETGAAAGRGDEVGIRPAFSAAGLDGPSSVTVQLRVTDSGGLEASDTATIEIHNVAPVIVSLVNSSPSLCGAGAVQGQQVSVSGAFSDAGLPDTHTATVAWGDGTSSAGIVTESNGSGTVAASHAYLHGGFYTITMSVFDDDGGMHSMTTQTVIAGANVQNGVLVIVGTNAADHVSVNLSGPPTAQRFDVHGEFGPTGGADGGSDGGSDGDFDAASINEIQAIMCGGDDHVQIAANILVPALIDAGAGNDHINGGGGPNILIGGDGDDMLIGGSGRDVMIGGYGADRLVGNASEDLMIAGYTSHDGNYAALSSIRSEWTSAASYADRLAHLRGTLGGGLNGSIFLKGDDENLTAAANEVGGQTVFDDNAVDRLTGCQGIDWFLANTLRDNSSVLDIITDLASAETASDIDLNLL